MNMVYSDRFINLAHSKAIHPSASHNFRVGKSYEELYGVEKANDIKKQISERSTASKGKLKPWAERHPDKDHPSKGRTFSEDQKERNRLRRSLCVTTVEKRQEASQHFTALWQDLEYQIKVAQGRGTHYTAIKICPECGKYFGGSDQTKAFHKKLYCSYDCAALNKKTKLPYICISPDGISEITTDLKQFCIDNLIKFSEFKPIKHKQSGYSQGWTCKLADKPLITSQKS